MIKLFSISIFILLLINISTAQVGSINLQQAIRTAQENSFAYKIAQNRRQGSIWRFENYKVSLLPSLYMQGNIPNYTRAISRITLHTGADTFVSQNQAYSSVNFGVRQNISLTGGTIAVNSFLNRIDVFGAQRQTRYSSTPFSLSYNQEVIGYNGSSWQKKIEPLQLESANRQFVSDMERIAGQTASYFFTVLAAKARYELAIQNHEKVDTLLRISEDRFYLGNVDQSTLLQLRLNSLNAQKQLSQDSIEYILAKQQFKGFLRLAPQLDFMLLFDEEVDFFPVPLAQAMIYANENTQYLIDAKLRRLEAEQALAKIKAQNGLKLNINANFGISNTSNTLGDIFSGIENQQQISLGVSLPLIDWGFARTQKQRASANYAMVESEIEQQQLSLEQEVSLCVARWQLQKKQIQVVKESREIALKNYALETHRYLRGTISINDLNLAQQQKDLASNAYIDAIRGYWDLYYTLRRLTHYDFRNNQKIGVDN